VLFVSRHETIALTFEISEVLWFYFFVPCRGTQVLLVSFPRPMPSGVFECHSFWVDPSVPPAFFRGKFRPPGVAIPAFKDKPESKVREVGSSFLGIPASFSPQIDLVLLLFDFWSSRPLSPSLYFPTLGFSRKIPTNRSSLPLDVLIPLQQQPLTFDQSMFFLFSFSL